MPRLFLLTVTLMTFNFSKAQPSYSNTHPEWSPTGDLIAFTSNRDGNVEIYVVGTDGRNERRLTYHDQVDAELSWSPDGSRIAFNAREKENGDFEIYVINVDGSNRVQLTFNDAGDYTPVWDPDGTKIMFSSNRDYPGATDMEGNRELYTMNIDGSGVVRITNFNARTSTPAYHVDGGKVAFTSDMDGDYEVYTMRVDGSSVRQHTYNEEFDWYPRWNRMGGLIYTAGSWEPYRWEVKQLDFKGGYSTIVEVADSGNASFSPDFSKMVFCKEVDGVSDLYVMDEKNGTRRLLSK